MGFYATNERPELIDHPPKNRVVGSAAFSFSRTGSTWSETQCSRLENDPTATTTVSGMCFYGYRFYSPVLGRWINRDPLRELGGSVNLLSFLDNNPQNYYDYLGLTKQGGESVGFLEYLRSLGGCALQIADGLLSGRTAGKAFQDLIDRGYECCSEYAGGQAGNNDCCVKWTPIEDYNPDGDGKKRTWSIAHQMWGCEMKKKGVTRECLDHINTLWESWEIARGDADEYDSTEEYINDMIKDMEDVLSGWDAAPSDCSDLVPDSCAARKQV